MESEGVDPTHYGIAVILLMVTVASLVMTIINLRNGRSWLVRFAGRQAAGVVTNIEIVTDPNGEVLRRPVVAFTTAEGQAVQGSPVVYRRKLSLNKGAAVKLRYVRRDPARIVLHGYDLRLREPVYAILGVVIALVIALWYFDL